MSVDWTTEATAAAAIRLRLDTDMSNAALHALAKAAIAEIAERGIGTGGTVSLAGGGRYLWVSRPIAAITSVTEGTTVVDATDYRFEVGGHSIERRLDGFQSVWGYDVTVVYTAVAANERYDRVVVDLVKLSVEYSGLARRADGDYREDAMGSRAGGTSGGYQEEREALISELRPAGLGFA